MSIIGLDIGGANLKCSDGTTSKSVPFPLWQRPENLTSELKKLLDCYEAVSCLAVTMTGELADCYPTRRIGVQRIVQSVVAAADGCDVSFWQTGGEFLNAEEATEFPELVAAANWHALATWAGRVATQESALLIDIGSTTTDIIPLQNSLPDPKGLTDLERLKSGELVYTGVRRTPLCAIAYEVELKSQPTPLAAELFSTTQDVALILGEIAEDEQNCETANGRPATKQEAYQRLARMFCSDCNVLTEQELFSAAEQLQSQQIKRLEKAYQQVRLSLSQPPHVMILTGEGEFLAKKLLDTQQSDANHAEQLSLNRLLGPQHSTAACAYALAQLGRERL